MVTFRPPGGHICRRVRFLCTFWHESDGRSLGVFLCRDFSSFVRGSLKCSKTVLQRHLLARIT